MPNLVDLQPIQQFIQETILFVPRLLVAIAIYLSFWVVSFIIGAAARRWGSRIRLDESLRMLFVRLTRSTVLIIGIITALGTALQDIIKNVLSGILILMYRPFRRGYYIQVGDKMGVVTDIDLRYTTLQTDAVRILIPNANMFTESIIVFNQPPSLPS
jgi:small-conductance mechanosensitive channel